MPTSRSRRSTRGSALIMSVILIAVLSAIGVAAVALAARERQSAAAKAHLEELRACAAAAQAKIWAEISHYGSGYLNSTNLVESVTLPDGTKLTAPSHYDPDLTKTIQEVVLIGDKVAATAGAGDLTNTIRGASAGGTIYRLTVHCTDKSGRQLELEMGLRLAI